MSLVERQDYLARIEQLRRQNVVPSKGFLDLYGTTETGEFVLAPNSFAKGYQHSFLPAYQRPYLAFDFLGIFGQLSDRTWVFIPSYRRGLAHGNERQTNVKLIVLAEGERQLFQEVNVHRQSLSELRRQLEEAQSKIKELEGRVSEQDKNRRG